MRIIRNDVLFNYILSPLKLEERQDIGFIISNFKPGDKIRYGGRESKNDEEIYSIYFEINDANKKFILIGNTEEDKNEIKEIRNACFFGSGSLIYLGKTDFCGEESIIITLAYCKLCNKQIIDFSECNGLVCNSCADKCEHKYVPGFFHGTVDIGVGEICSICNRVKPEIRKKSLKEHHLAVKEAGIILIDKKTLHYSR